MIKTLQVHLNQIHIGILAQKDDKVYFEYNKVFQQTLSKSRAVSLWHEGLLSMPIGSWQKSPFWVLMKIARELGIANSTINAIAKQFVCQSCVISASFLIR